jgi:hypothetical protein
LYTGKVTFTSSDGAAALPTNYRFTKADMGSHTFTVTLKTASASPQTITVTDTVHGTITGTASVTVNGGSAAPPVPDAGSSHTATGSLSDPHGRDSMDLVAMLADAAFQPTDLAPSTFSIPADSVGSRMLDAADSVPGLRTDGTRYRTGILTSRPAPIGILSAGGAHFTRLPFADLEAFFTSEAFSGGIA